ESSLPADTSRTRRPFASSSTSPPGAPVISRGRPRCRARSGHATATRPLGSDAMPRGAQYRRSPSSVTPASFGASGSRRSNVNTRFPKAPLANTRPSYRNVSFSSCGSFPRERTGTVASTRPYFRDEGLALTTARKSPSLRSASPAQTTRYGSNGASPRPPGHPLASTPRASTTAPRHPVRPRIGALYLHSACVSTVAHVGVRTRRSARRGAWGRGYGFGSVARMNLHISAATVSARRFAGAYASPPRPSAAGAGRLNHHTRSTRARRGVPLLRVRLAWSVATRRRRRRRGGAGCGLGAPAKRRDETLAAETCRSTRATEPKPPTHTPDPLGAHPTDTPATTTRTRRDEL